MNLPHPSNETSGTRWTQRLLESRVGSWLAALLFVAPPFIAANILTKLWIPSPNLLDLRNLIKTLVLVAAYWAYVHWWERRLVGELSVARVVPEILAGLVFGSLLFCGVVAVLATMGAYSISEVGTLGDLAAVVVSVLPKMAAGALIEELLFRLLLLRLLERSFGTGWALVTSSLIFGLAHLSNFGATPLISVMLGLELGLLFGAAYLLTRRIWLCFALHLGWNFAQGGVFAIAVSGLSGRAWLSGTLTGPSWLTGGDFGAEGSLVSVLLCLAMAALLLALAHRRGTFKLTFAPIPTTAS